MSSKNCEACKGCKHITNNNVEFCYMFLDQPNVLPCAQHDKYAEQRRDVIIRKYVGWG